MFYQNIKAEFKLPLLEVRPEACGILRSLKVDEPEDMPLPSEESPYFMEVTNKDKQFMSGINEVIFYRPFDSHNLNSNSSVEKIINKNHDNHII